MRSPLTPEPFGTPRDRGVIHYNDLITIRDIPLAAYDYVVNGKSAIEWVMERQSITTDKDSGIVKDANTWATETVGEPRYPLSLLLRMITVSLETLRIVEGLPALDVVEDGGAPNEGEVLPFRRVTPTLSERYGTCVPLIELEVAAGAWSNEQEGVREPDHPEVDWVTWETPRRFAKGMFVARVSGRSMEPAIPDRAYCLFRQVARPSSPDRPVLVRHGGQADPETGGQYTLKLYREQKGSKGEKQIVLQPANPEFAPLVIAPDEVEEIRVLAEVVEVLAP